MTPYFPPELVAHTLSLFERQPHDRTRTLLACSLVCRAWRPLAQSALLRQVSLGDTDLSSEEQVSRLVEAAGRERGGWKCEFLNLGGLRLCEAGTVLHAAKEVRTLVLSITDPDKGQEYVEDEVDWVGIASLSALESVYHDYASLPPTSSGLPGLGSISADDRCQAGPALSTFLGAAPNLEQLELHLDGNIPQALATTDSSNLTKLRSLIFWVNERDCQGLPDPEGTCAFVAGCSAKLESVEFGPFTALEHLGLLEAIDSPPKKIVMHVLLEDNMDEEFYVGSVVRDMVDQKAASAVEEWAR